MALTLYPSNMKTCKKLYILCLLGAFWYSIITSYLVILEEPTSFEETELTFAASFPSFTICRRQWDMDDLDTFLDVMQEIIGFHSLLKTELGHFGKHIESTSFDLQNITILSQEFNATFEEVWTFSAMLQPHLSDETKGTPIIPCFSLNLPKLRQLQIEEYYYVSKSHTIN